MAVLAGAQFYHLRVFCGHRESMDFVVGILQVLRDLLEERALGCHCLAAVLSRTIHLLKLPDFVDSVYIKTGLAEGVPMLAVTQPSLTPPKLGTANLTNRYPPELLNFSPQQLGELALLLCLRLGLWAGGLRAGFVPDRLS